VESARLREKQLENEIGKYKQELQKVSIDIHMICIGSFVFLLVDLRNELSKEQDCRQKLEQDIVELRRVRSTKSDITHRTSISMFMNVFPRCISQKIETSQSVNINSSELFECTW
jgi:hypothetical protein